MRRHFPTILLAVVLGGLGAYLYFVEVPTERHKTEQEAKRQKLLTIEEREITGLDVAWPSSSVALEKRDGRWMMTKPVATEGDPREIEAMIRALVLGKVNRVVEEHAANLEPFGLAHPPVTVTVKAGTREERIALGDTGPISSTLYAQRPPEHSVLLTDLAARDFLSKSVFTFRKKELLAIDQSKVDRLRLASPQTEIVLYREEEPGGRPKWKIRFPIETGADQPEVRALVIKLEDLKALAFLDPGPEHDALLKTLTTPEMKLTVHQDGADQTVKFYRTDPAKGEAYAVMTADGPIYRVNPAVVQELKKDLFTLQDKRLLGLEKEQIALLTVKGRDRHFTLINQNDEWVLESRPQDKIDQQKAAIFVSRVAELPAELRVIKHTGPLAPYGLATPSLEITATGKDGKRIGRLILGTKVGGLVYAMGQRLPGVFQARADLLTQVPSEAELLAKPSN
ncbi:MAG TPA: DUF4340 domain-containing protein [Nitrospirales bacterium]|nr:DUF4340 domain-containing protein [Nitrospirales bacterium]